MTSSKDFMVTALILVTGSITDRMGGASMFPLSGILVNFLCEPKLIYTS